MVDRVAVRAWLAALQDGLVDAIERADGAARFGRDRWERPDGGGGESRVLKDGALIEQGGVNFSEVSGASLPASATHDRPALAGAPFSAMGVSLVLHPKNPHVPTTHLNLRFFIATPAGAEPAWWFGGGFDLTPFYPVREDVLHWHRMAREACASLPGSYERYKAWCDRYFFLPHRNETRGVGGLFFDDLNTPSFAECFAFARAVGDVFPKAWLPIAGAAPRDALRRARARVPAVAARALRGVQPGARPRHAVRPADRRAHRVDPDVAAAARALGVRLDAGAGVARGCARARVAAPARLARRSMNYRHAFHAGNFADVMKHAALVAALERLTEKDRPLFLLDTHAGRGRYDLAATGGEAAGGIARVLAAGLDDTHPALARYLAIVRGMNEGDRLGSYPGSPMIEAAFMRAGDRAAFCELLTGEADALRRLFRGDARVGVHCRDGFEALAALLPPPEKRGLALIDPPYEEQERDLERVAEALVAAAARWPQGALMAWYPIKWAPSPRGCIAGSWMPA